MDPSNALFSQPPLSACVLEESTATPAIRWQITDDGALTIEAPGITLVGAYPAWDDAPLRPLAVAVTRTPLGAELRYRCMDGTLVLVAAATAEGLSLRATLLGFPRAPRRLLMLGPARLEGAVAWMQNGQPRSLVQPADAPVEDDYGLVNAFISAGGGTLAIGPHDHRRFRAAGRVTGRDALADGMHVAMGYHLETLAIPAEGLELPALFITWGPRPLPTLRAFARAIATEMGARQRFGPGNHWCSWYSEYYNFCLADLEALLAGLAASPSPGLRAVQIDAGYFTAPGDWLSPNHRWPGGLQAAFAKITEAGFLPGIWIAPYMAGVRSRIVTENPDWILRRHDGTPVVAIHAHGEEKVWGYPDEEWYVLDSSHPGVTGHILTCLRTLRGWGARFFKTDFLFWAFMEPGDDQVRRHTPGLTSMERMRALLGGMREAIGEDAFWLGCLAPVPPMIGFADALRTGGDNAAVWPLDPSVAGHSASHLIHSSWAMQFINGIFWQNDADALILRDYHTSLSDSETHTLALWVAALGGAVNTSELLHKCSPARRRLWRFCTQGPDAAPADLPFWGLPGHPLHLIIRPYPAHAAWAVLIANTSGETQSETFDFSSLLESDTPLTVASWGPENSGRLENDHARHIELPSHHHRLWWVSARGDAPPPGFTLGGASLPSEME